MPEKQIICAWYSNKMSINRLSAPNSNICLIWLCAWCNFIILTSDYNIFSIFIEEQDTNTGVDLQKNIHTMTVECKYSVLTKPSYISSQPCTKSSTKSAVCATTQAMSQRFYLQAVRLLLCTRGQAQAKHSGKKPFKCSIVHTATFLVQQPVIWWLANWHILVKNLSLVYNATFPAHKLAT